jgi:hypothetical protein
VIALTDITHGAKYLAPMIAMAVIALGTVSTVAFAAITGINEWSQLVILGGIALVTIGTMIAFDPLRREER